MIEEEIEPPQWCVVANVRKVIHYGPNQGDWTQIGTKHLSPGTKIYVRGANWDAEFTKISVVGKHRGTSRLTLIVIRPSWLTNYRAQVVYSPRVLRKLRERRFPGPTSEFPVDASEDSKAKAEYLVNYFSNNFPLLRQDSTQREQE